MKQYIPGSAAILAAVEYAGLTEQEVYDVSVRSTDGLYEVTFATDWMRYDCYVDAADYEVLGFDSAPIPERLMLAEQIVIPA